MFRFIQYIMSISLLMYKTDCLKDFNSKFILDFFTQRHLKTIVIFDCSANAEEILPTFKYLNHHYNGSLKIVKFREGSHSINHLEVMRSYPSDLGVTIHLECPHVNNLFDVMSRQNFFNASYEWLLFGSCPIKKSIILLQTQNLNMDSRITLAIPNDEILATFELFEVYNVYHQKKGNFHVKSIGHWNYEQGFQLTWNPSEYERRADFERLRLRVIFTDMTNRHNETIMERLETNKPIKSYSIFRFGHHYVKMLQEKHQFRAQFVQVPTWGFESIGKNNSAGVIGQLKDKLADIAEDPFYIFPERIYLLDFTAIIGHHTTMIVFRHPKHPDSSKAFLDPFGWDVWYALLAMTVATCLTMYVIFRQEDRISQGISLSSREYILSMVAYLCQQGCDGTALIYGSKVSLLVAVIFFFMMFQFYATFILGSLLTPPAKYIKSARQLVDSSLGVGIESVFYNKEFMKSFYSRSTDPAVRELFTKKITKSPSELNASFGLKMVQQGGFAFQCDTGYAYPIIKATFTDDEICDLQDIQIVPPGPLYLPLQKGSPLKQFFRVTFWKLLESGSGRYYDRVYFSRKPPCPKTDLDTEEIGMGQVLCLFYFYGVSIGICLVLLVYERIRFRYQRLRRVLEYVP